MKQLFDRASYQCSKVVTKKYSTSFSLAVKMLSPKIREAIYSIYGFVRLADEIVDTFHAYDKKFLLNRFESDYYRAMKDGISLNPILNSFVLTVKKYQITDDLIARADRRQSAVGGVVAGKDYELLKCHVIPN